MFPESRGSKSFDALKPFVSAPIYPFVDGVDGAGLTVTV